MEVRLVHSSNEKVMRYTSLKKQDRAEDGMEVRLVHSSNETVKTGGAKGLMHSQFFKGNI